MTPAVVNLRAVLDLTEGEDEVLRGAEEQTADPCACDHGVGPPGGLLEGLERVADGDIAI